MKLWECKKVKTIRLLSDEIISLLESESRLQISLFLILFMKQLMSLSVEVS